MCLSWHCSVGWICLKPALVKSNQKALWPWTFTFHVKVRLKFRREGSSSGVIVPLHAVVQAARRDKVNVGQLQSLRYLIKVNSIFQDFHINLYLSKGVILMHVCCLLVCIKQYVSIKPCSKKKGKTWFTNVFNNLHHEDSFWLWTAEDHHRASTERQRRLAWSSVANFTF